MRYFSLEFTLLMGSSKEPISIMKTVALFVLVGLSLKLSGQAIQPPKGANTFVYNTEMPKDSAYQKLGEALVQGGYSIDVNNKEFGQMKTGWKATEYYNFKYQLTATVGADGKVRIKAVIDYGPPVGESEWTYTKSKITKDYKLYEDVINKLAALGTVSLEKL
jgi:hypothetical protein